MEDAVYVYVCIHGRNDVPCTLGCHDNPPKRSPSVLDFTCEMDHCTPEERAVIDAALNWYHWHAAHYEVPLIKECKALLTTRKEQNENTKTD